MTSRLKVSSVLQELHSYSWATRWGNFIHLKIGGNFTNMCLGVGRHSWAVDSLFLIHIPWALCNVFYICILFFLGALKCVNVLIDNVEKPYYHNHSCRLSSQKFVYRLISNMNFWMSENVLLADSNWVNSWVGRESPEPQGCPYCRCLCIRL